jgi:hypothetical protein
MPLLPAGAGELSDVPGAAGDEARAVLAGELAQVGGGSAELSDRLSRRYFALIETDTHALAT